MIRFSNLFEEIDTHISELSEEERLNFLKITFKTS